MCRRYMFEPDKNDTIKQIYQTIETNNQQIKTGQVFPGNVSAVLVLSGNGESTPVPMYWGRMNHDIDMFYNARAETVLENKLFAGAFKANRCVFPTNGFFEWTPDEIKYYFDYTEDQTLYICGFYWQLQDGCRSCMLTTAADQSVQPIHDRMPLIIEEKDIKSFISDETFATNFLTHSMPELSASKAK